MRKTSIALSALLIAGGLAAPVLANDDSNFDAGYLLTQLNQSGVEAVAIEPTWNGQVRATVKLADGSEQFQYFYEDTLQPVVAPRGNIRVLSDLDVGAPVRPTGFVVTPSLLDTDD
jgi:hypothetical protein